MKFPPMCLWFCLLLCVGQVPAAAPARAWVDDGHQLIANVAYAGLSAQAKKNVDFLLRGTTLNKAAVWPDAMRSWQRNPAKPEPAALRGDPQADLFFHDSRNAGQPSWHFTDMPIGFTDYASSPVGAGPEDVVHALRRCIAVLQGHPKQGENLNAPQALRLLIHYAGDIHQPLHAASGYWLAEGAGGFRLATAAESAGAAKDGGGNNLSYGQGQFDELHAYWDTHLVDTTVEGMRDSLPGHRARLGTAAHRLGSVPYTLGGDPINWPEKWANESAVIAARAYQPFHQPTHGKITTNTPTFSGSITIPADYDAVFKPVVDQRLALAGFRLAAVLNAVLSDRDLASGVSVQPARSPRRRQVPGGGS